MEKSTIEERLHNLERYVALHHEIETKRINNQRWEKERITKLIILAEKIKESMNLHNPVKQEGAKS